MIPLNTTEFKRTLGLDIIRASAILLVVIGHSANLLSPLQTLPFGVGFIFGKILELTSYFGLLGVELFFVLSGFLIGGILIKEFIKEEPFNLNSVKVFYIRRWFRTLPLYYLMFVILLLVNYRQIGNSFDWKFLFFLQNFFQPHPHFFGEAWSLAIEEWFYLTLPLFLLATGILFKRSSKQKILLETFTLYFFVFFMLRILNALYPLYPDQDTGIRRVVVFRLDAVMYGVFMAYFKQFYMDTFLKLSRKLLWIGITGIVLLVLFAYLGAHPRFDFYSQNRIFRFCSDAFLFTLVPLCFSFFLPYADSIKGLPNKGLEKMITHISLISYSMYLVHFSLVYITFFNSLETANSFIAIGYFLLYWLIVLGLSSLLYSFFERPMTGLRARFSRRAAENTEGNSK